MGLLRDNSTAGSSAGASSLTFAHTVSGADRILLVYVAMDGSGTPGWEMTPTGVTYNGVAMTIISGATASRASCRGTWWYLVNPDTGTHDVVISFSSACSNIMGMAHSYTGADQASQPDASSNQIGMETADSIADGTITTLSDNAMIVSGCLGSENWAGLTAQSPLVARHQTGVSGFVAATADYLKAAAGAQDCDWGISNYESWAMSNVSIKESAAAPAGQPIAARRKDQKFLRHSPANLGV